MNWKNLLGIKTISDKIQEYKTLVSDMDAILLEGANLQKSLADIDGLRQSIAISSDIEKSISRYNKAKKDHEEAVVKCANKKGQIEKAINKLKNDPDVGGIISDNENIRDMRSLMRDGKIKREMYFDFIKKTKGKNQYADSIIVRYPQPENGVHNSITQGAQVLLLERVEDNIPSNLWCIPGGSIEIGEDAFECAKRELFEETNLNLGAYPQLSKDMPDLEFVGERKDKDIEISYYKAVVPEFDALNIILDSDEHCSYVWCPIEKLSDYEFQYDDQRKIVEQVLMPWKIVSDAVELYNDGIITKSVFDAILDKNMDSITKANKHYFSEKEREELAKEGEAMPDGSFPIRNTQDLKDAIRLAGMAKNPNKARKWIKKRAKELGEEDLIPETWLEKTLDTENCGCLATESIDGEKKKVEKSIDSLSEEQRSTILDMLYSRLSEEFNAWYQYYIPTKFLQGNERVSVEKTFIEHADDELNDHAGKLLQRISELGGDITKLDTPNKWIEQAKCEYLTPLNPYDVIPLIIQNKEAEECAIRGYEELAKYTQHLDPTTYFMALEILKDEEEHLRDLKDFLADMDVPFEKSKKDEPKKVEKVKEVEVKEEKQEKSPDDFVKETSTDELIEFISNKGSDEELIEIAKEEIKRRFSLKKEDEK